MHGLNTHARVRLTCNKRRARGLTPRMRPSARTKPKLPAGAPLPVTKQRKR